MRASSWWVRRLLGNMLDYTDDAVKNLKVDEEMSESSDRAVSNRTIKAYVDNAVKNVKVDVDTAMSSSSDDPVSNRVIKAYVDSTVQSAIISALKNDY